MNDIAIETPHSPKEQEYWLVLAHAPGVGPIKFAYLLKHFKTPKAVFEADESELRELGIKGKLWEYLRNPEWQIIEKDLRWLEKPNNHLLTLSDSDYPQHLREIHDPPPILFVHGDYTLLASRQIAIVGTRSASRNGEMTAQKFAEKLSRAGLTITSGLAYGIDAASHRGALAANGKTIAVAGTGLDRVYPPKHYELAHKIAENGGALVSEFHPGIAAQHGNFPRRNRIISGLSLGTLVIEAGLTSGALITAREAVEQGREVFAIPGSIYDPLSKGCHALIKEGAKLVEKTSDILEELFDKKNFFASAPLVSSAESSDDADDFLLLPNIKDSDLDEEQKHLLECMGTSAISIDNLVDQSGLTVEAISSTLLMLELRGWVASHSGGLYVRCTSTVRRQAPF
jgi:DNA processing protein